MRSPNCASTVEVSARANLNWAGQVLYPIYDSDAAACGFSGSYRDYCGRAVRLYAQMGTSINRVGHRYGVAPVPW